MARCAAHGGRVGPRPQRSTNSCTGLREIGPLAQFLTGTIHGFARWGGAAGDRVRRARHDRGHRNGGTARRPPRPAAVGCPRRRLPTSARSPTPWLHSHLGSGRTPRISDVRSLQLGQGSVGDSRRADRRVQPPPAPQRSGAASLQRERLLAGGAVAGPVSVRVAPVVAALAVPLSVAAVATVRAAGVLTILEPFPIAEAPACR